MGLPLAAAFSLAAFFIFFAGMVTPSCFAEGNCRLGGGARPRYCEHMSIAAEIVMAVVVSMTAVIVIGLFIWAAVKDGEEDRALQARLGIRRRTRLGR